MYFLLGYMYEVWIQFGFEGGPEAEGECESQPYSCGVFWCELKSQRNTCLNLGNIPLHLRNHRYSIPKDSLRNRYILFNFPDDVLLHTLHTFHLFCHKNKGTQRRLRMYVRNLGSPVWT